MNAIVHDAGQLMLRRIARGFRQARRHGLQRGSHRGLIVPPASPGGLGDDALMRSLSFALKSTGFTHLEAARYEPVEQWHIPDVLPGPMLPQRGLLSWLRFLRATMSFDSAFVVGADMLDGAYGTGPSMYLLELADLTARLGVPTTIVGASFNDHAPEAIRRKIRSVSDDLQFFARDPVSEARLKPLHRVQISADIAFLLRSASPSESPLVSDVTSWIATRRQQGAQWIIGCNVNPYPAVTAGHDVDELVTQYVSALQRISTLHGPVAVVFLSHDRRAPYDDRPILKRISDALPHSFDKMFQPAIAIADSSETKAIVANCDLLLTGRMHLAIAGLSSSIPTVCIGYQAKCEGLFSYFGCDHMVIDSERVFVPEQLGEVLSQAIFHHSEIKTQIELTLPRVLDRSWRNVRKPAATLPTVEA